MFRYLVPALSLLLGACGGVGAQDEPDTFQPDPRPMGKTLVYECDGYEFIARIGPGEMALWLQDRYVILSQVRSASGTRYEEGDISFWSKGDEALLQIGARRIRNCALAPERVPWEDARRRGVNFRATGNEPGWYVEIQHARQILYVGDYGMNRLLVPTPEPLREDGRVVYQSSDGETGLRIEISEERCVDTMSGREFPSDVLLMVEGQGYRGCGMVLEQYWK